MQGKMTSKELLEKEILSDDDDLIENLEKKLKESVIVTGDLRDLLQKLPADYTMERYYEEMASKNMTF
jgi:hypothetical protein